MDALTPAEVFSLRRAEQLVALGDLREAQLRRVPASDAAARSVVTEGDLVVAGAAARR